MVYQNTFIPYQSIVKYSHCISDILAWYWNSTSIVERDKKNLIATHKGIGLVTIVADTFKSAETTAKWEMELSDIAQGKSSKKNFLEAIETEIKEVVSTYIK